MRALVTGATGFVGGYLVRELQRRGDEVTAVMRPSSGGAQLEWRGVELVREDLRRPSGELQKRLEHTDVVYHLAAGVTSNWRGTFETNVTTTENLVRCIQEASWPGRMVHVSSLAVYGLNQLRPGTVIDESTPLEPRAAKRDDYAWSKLWQERLISRLNTAESSTVIVRPGAVYGRERQFQYRLGRVVGGGTLLLLGGRNVMPLTYVENTASLLAECGRHEGASGQVFNCIDPEPITQWTYMRRWRRAQPNRVTVVPVPLTLTRALGAGLTMLERRTHGRLGPPAFLDPYVMEPSFRRFRYAPSRAIPRLGWRPPVPLADALSRTFGSS